MNRYIWPQIFTGELTVEQRIAQGKTRNHGLVALCADGLCAWANCMSGNKPPARFGDVMVEISKAVGVSAHPPENLAKRTNCSASNRLQLLCVHRHESVYNGLINYGMT